MANKLFQFFLFALLIVVGASCGGDDSEKKSSQNRDFLPNATLLPHEMLVVMDSAQWKGLLGDAVRDVFTEPIPGMPQEEPQFTLRYIEPQNLRGFQKRYPNILFVFTLDNNSRSTQLLQSMFSQNSLEQIRQDPQRFMITRQDEFAKGQELMYLFSNTEDQLISRLYSSKQQLLRHFQDLERQRTMRDISRIKSTKNVGQMLSRQYGFTMDFPAGYELADQDSNFVWIRLLDNKVDKSIWITWKPFTSQKAFEPENILSFRNRVARKYIWGNDSTTYMRLENQLAPTMREVNFGGRYAIETRGLWRLEKLVMGGPFISYTFVDEPTNRLYYIEGFTYAPGQNKRTAINELEAALWTFKTTGNQKK